MWKSSCRYLFSHLHLGGGAGAVKPQLLLWGWCVGRAMTTTACACLRDSLHQRKISEYLFFLVDSCQWVGSHACFDCRKQKSCTDTEVSLRALAGRSLTQVRRSFASLPPFPEMGRQASSDKSTRSHVKMSSARFGNHLAMIDV